MEHGRFTVRVPRVGALTASVRTALEVALFVILAGTLLWRSWQLDRANERAGRIALEADTLRAAADTSKLIALRLDAKVQATQRQVVQREQRADSIDRQLRLSRAALARLSVRVETLFVTGGVSTDPVTETNGDRSARFVVDSTPYHVRLSVTLPPAPARGRLDSLSVRLDSVGLEARLGCSIPNAAGIRSAFVTVIAPTWAPVRIWRVEQDPGLCRSPALEPKDSRPRWRRILDRAGVSVGVDVHGKPNALAGFKVWP